MGLGRTLQEVEGWRGQYDRVLRWQRRIRTADEARSSADQLDFLLAFFASCFDLRDWLIASGVDRKSVTALFRSNVELRVCRDIANGFKHFSITVHPYDAGIFGCTGVCPEKLAVLCWAWRKQMECGRR